MARRLTHAEIEEMLAAYALDAVERDEAAAVEAHLPECPRCAAEVGAHREVAASLAHAGSSAPEGLWDRIAGALEEAPPALDLSRVPRFAPAPRPSYARALTAVIAAAAVVIAALGVQVVRQEQRVDRLTEVTRQRALEQAAASASSDEKAVRVTLRSEDGRTYGEATVLENGTGYLVRHNLPPLGGNRTYQLWGKLSDRNVSLAVLGPSPGVTAFNVYGEVTKVAITDEPAGGAVTPTGPLVAQGFLPDR